MSETKDNIKQIEDKLKYLGLDLNDIPEDLLNIQSIRYRPLKSYDDTNYKVYRYVDIKDIEILITPVDRLEDINEKLKKAKPLSYYMVNDNQDNIEEYTMFINMISHLDIDKIDKIEEEQKTLNKNIPYEIKYRNNYIWQIYYSESDDRYFMLFSSNENNAECLFYLIKKKLEVLRNKKNEKIYIPICHLDYSNKLLKKSEISDLENYLWLFTKDWPSIYEVYDINDNMSIQIIGKTTVYDKIKSLYKIVVSDKKEAEKTYKLIKALFILQSNEEYNYNFKTLINAKGGLDFSYNMSNIKYDNLSEFIRQQVEIKRERTNEVRRTNIILNEKLELLKETVKKQKDEYLAKEKQITNFLECKRSFFGKVRYFFKKPKKQEITDIQEVNEQLKENKNIDELEKIEDKKMYTIEDLLKVSDILSKEEIIFKNAGMDIKALEIKKENLEKKIQNATLYINEIESHKKSIFDFWKFTNKDENNMLLAGEENQDANKNRLKKVFEFEEDIEDFGKSVDNKQRTVFNKNECDAIFALKQDIDTFNILSNDKNLKRDDNKIQKQLNNFIQDYMDDIDIINEKDFDIFGNVSEDKTKIKTLNNNKHREIEKDKYKILYINPETTLEEYKENIDRYRILLEEGYEKMQCPYDISIYKIKTQELNDKYEIMNLNAKEEIYSSNIENEKDLKLYKVNVKENMPIIFYTNIMYFDNLNKTLPLGMDVDTNVLIDLSKYEKKLVSRKDFNINYLTNEFENIVKFIQVYEYDIEKI